MLERFFLVSPNLRPFYGMTIFSIFISLALLWFLVTLFTRSTNSSQTLTESWIIVIGMLIVNLLSKLFLYHFLGIFTLVVNIIALYFLVDKICGTPKSITIRICAWYFGLTFVMNLFFNLILS